MSAYVVNKRHIDAMITGALELSRRDREFAFRWYHEKQSQELKLENASAIGAMLWTENVRSVAYRYPHDGSGDRPGPIGFQDEEAATYTYEQLAEPLTPIELLVAISGLEYQSCEHPEWDESRAHAFLEALQRKAIHHLPGYDEAKTWEVDYDRPVVSFYRRPVSIR